ncbi:hypothetical protein QK908_01765 [Lactococcus cremoris]
MEEVAFLLTALSARPSCDFLLSGLFIFLSVGFAFLSADLSRIKIFPSF